MNTNISNSSWMDPPYRTLFNPPFIVSLYRYGLTLIFFIGLLGNCASIMTFTRRNLRHTSTCCLFLAVAVADTMFLLICIFDFVEVGIVKGPIFLSHYDSVCRFRWFSRGFTRFCSAWILVIVSIDRWFRTRFPFHTNKFCTCSHAFGGISVVVVISCALHSHLLSPHNLGRQAPGIPSLACGPANPFSSYLYFFFITWPIIQVSLICVVPAILILAFGFETRRILRREKRRIQPSRSNGRHKHAKQIRLNRHMFLLMIISSIVFCLTCLPISLRQIITSFQVSFGIVTDVSESVTQEAVLTVLLTLNYTINFYIYCLASRFFRHEFLRSTRMLLKLADPNVLSVFRTTRNNDFTTNTNHISLAELQRTNVDHSHIVSDYEKRKATIDP